jgi:hypothetical protein
VLTALVLSLLFSSGGSSLDGAGSERRSGGSSGGLPDIRVRSGSGSGDVSAVRHTLASSPVVYPRPQHISAIDAALEGRHPSLLAAVFHIAKAVTVASVSHDLDGLLALLLRECTVLCHASSARFALVTNSSISSSAATPLGVAALSSPTSPHSLRINGRHFPLGRGLVGEAHRRGDVIRVERPTTDPRYSADIDEVQAERVSRSLSHTHFSLAIPIFIMNGTIRAKYAGSIFTGSKLDGGHHSAAVCAGSGYASGRCRGVDFGKIRRIRLEFH